MQNPANRLGGMVGRGGFGRGGRGGFRRGAFGFGGGFAPSFGFGFPTVVYGGPIAVPVPYPVAVPVQNPQPGQPVASPAQGPKAQKNLTPVAKQLCARLDASGLNASGRASVVAALAALGYKPSDCK